MRLRTRVTAWSYIAMHILGLVAWKLPPQSWRKPHSSDTDPMKVVLALVIPAGLILLRVHLLKKRTWFWWTLVVIFTVSGLANMSSFVTSVTRWGSVIAGFMLLGGIMLRGLQSFSRNRLPYPYSPVSASCPC